MAATATASAMVKVPMAWIDNKVILSSLFRDCPKQNGDLSAILIRRDQIQAVACFSSETEWSAYIVTPIAPFMVTVPNQTAYDDMIDQLLGNFQDDPA